ncbi:hypothetical protein [Epilithonimonas lactis]|uniref:Lipoprotein n=1 Tax=Epilithonimonas lactis TaxID=421072 RepID=A0A085BJV6_9FLAO|nr:hypothetical protein [Epilithonimonas lactis]KFC22751.1 hypothetical protein IO89_06775 [Epilithonimonas lactis]SEQ86207.1 hypothetical protein SAMN04488097_3274 [Epilithonimonas lactis]
MKKVLLFLLIALFSCDENNKKEIDWTKNGTLHESKISDWKISTEENKLATCADFVANLKNTENEKYETLSEMKNDAINLQSCIEEAVNGGIYAEEMKVKEVAVLCHIMIKSSN